MPGRIRRPRALHPRPVTIEAKPTELKPAIDISLAPESGPTRPLTRAYFEVTQRLQLIPPDLQSNNLKANPTTRELIDAMRKLNKTDSPVFHLHLAKAAKKHLQKKGIETILREDKENHGWLVIIRAFQHHVLGQPWLVKIASSLKRRQGVQPRLTFSTRDFLKGRGRFSSEALSLDWDNLFFSHLNRKGVHEIRHYLWEQNFWKDMQTMRQKVANLFPRQGDKFILNLQDQGSMTYVFQREHNGYVTLKNSKTDEFFKIPLKEFKDSLSNQSLGEPTKKSSSRPLPSIRIHIIPAKIPSSTTQDPFLETVLQTYFNKWGHGIEEIDAYGKEHQSASQTLSRIMRQVSSIRQGEKLNGLEKKVIRGIYREFREREFILDELINYDEQSLGKAIAGLKGNQLTIYLTGETAPSLEPFGNRIIRLQDGTKILFFAEQIDANHPIGERKSLDPLVVSKELEKSLKWISLQRDKITRQGARIKNIP